MIVEQPQSPRECRPACAKGWALGSGRFRVKGHWFSSDLGQVTSHVTAWPIIGTLPYPSPNPRLH